MIITDDKGSNDDIIVDIVNGDNRHEWHPYLGSHSPHTNSVLSKYRESFEGTHLWLRQDPESHKTSVEDRMEVEAEDGFEAAENVTFGNPILADKDFIAIMGKYEIWVIVMMMMILGNYEIFWESSWHLVVIRRSDLLLGRNRDAGLPLHVCTHGQELFDEKHKVKEIRWIKFIFKKSLYISIPLYERWSDSVMFVWGCSVCM